MGGNREKVSHALWSESSPTDEGTFERDCRHPLFTDLHKRPLEGGSETRCSSGNGVVCEDGEVEGREVSMWWAIGFAVLWLGSAIGGVVFLYREVKRFKQEVSCPLSDEVFDPETEMTDAQ